MAKPGGGGGGGTPLYKPKRYVQPQTTVFLRRFGLKLGIDFVHLVWNQSLCLSSSLKMTTLFLPILGLKTEVNLRQPALKKKGVGKNIL